VGDYTETQGRYLSFIHKYTKLRGYAPSEPDIQMHFGVSAPTVHQMIVRLKDLGLIETTPYTARSIRILLPEDRLPAAVAARTARALISAGESKPPYTPKQGQYLAFIHHYAKVHGCPPSQCDIQRYFNVSAPSVHQMIVTLSERGFISRVPNAPRSIHVLLPANILPLLE
jgi:Mn-dependent DtxR family transcriptional regulator